MSAATPGRATALTIDWMLLVGLGGAIGSILRYMVSGLAGRWIGTEFPHGTLIVNLLGSFLIGVIHELGLRTLLVPEPLRIFLTIGVMGGLTTYSSFSYETVRLMEAGVWALAWINVTVTTILCLALSFLGIGMVRAMFGLRG